MADDPQNPVLQHLRHLRAGQDALRGDMGEAEGHLSTIEQRYASVSRRLDRMEACLERTATAA